MDSILNKLNINKSNYGSCLGGVDWQKNTNSGYIESINPENNEVIAKVFKCDENDYENIK